MALLCKGTTILIDAAGATCRVEDLDVGDTVLDPLAQKLVKVAHIIPWLAGQDSNTAPVFIPKHSLTATQPSSDFLAPQVLEILVARTPKGQALPSATRLLARDLVDEGIAHTAEQLSGYQCYLLGLDAPAMILTNGVLSVCKSATQAQSA